VATKTEIVLKPAAGITLEQARNACARAWTFVFQCWQGKQKADGSAPEPDSCKEAAIVRNPEEVSHVEQRPDRPSDRSTECPLVQKECISSD
jgi:hypothetical protein